MKSIQMYWSSPNLRAGLHGVLSTLVLAPDWAEGVEWWRALPDALHSAGKSQSLNLEQLATAVEDTLPRLNAARSVLGVPALNVEETRLALRRAVISGRAHKSHAGRDVYGTANKGVWDLVVAPVSRELECRWGEALVQPFAGVIQALDLDHPALLLSSALVAHKTGPRDAGHQTCVVWLAGELEAQGFAVRLHEGDGAPPVIEAHRPASGMAGHVVLYGHYDTVGAGGSWRTDPDQVNLVDGRLFARGVADNKGPLAARLWALSTLERTPELTWFIQGEEETGSRHARRVLAARVTPLKADLYLDETGYFEGDTGSLRLLARRVNGPVDSVLQDWIQAIRVLTSRAGLGARHEERGLNKTVVPGGCPFDDALPSGARVFALGVNDTGSAIHGPNESLPTWTIPLHRDQLATLFHCVDREASV